MIRKPDIKFWLYQRGGYPLNSKESMEDVIDVVRNHAAIKKLLTFSVPNADFNVFMDLIPASSNYVKGEQFGFKIEVPFARGNQPKEIMALLLSITPNGGFYKIWPKPDSNKTQFNLDTVRSRFVYEKKELAEIYGPNFGTEFLKLIIFINPDPIVKRKLYAIPTLNYPLTAQSIYFKEIMDSLKVSSGSISEMTIEVRTGDKK